MINNFTYNGIRTATQATAKWCNAEMLTLEIKLPIASESDIVDMYVETVQKEFNFAGF